MIRPMAEDERTFVRETCAKVRWPHEYSQERGRMWPSVLWSQWLADHGAAIDQWLEHGECLVYEERGVVLGFLVSTGHTLRCLYVKREFRGHRIGLALAAARWPGFIELSVYRPTPSLLQWARLHGLPWRQDEADRRAA